MAERFGRYELSRLAGQGGMALVHLARQVGPEGFVKPCVLKRIAPVFRADPDVRRMFLEEARVSALLNHPHIVQTFDYGEVEGAPYMAMELVDGVNLSQLCRTLAAKDRWIPLRSSIEICVAVAEALAYAHALVDLDGRSLHLVHRDVSPQNVLLSRQGGVKLADFGIARHDAREGRTLGLQAKGKPGYMAPEQALGVDVDPRADLYALGIVLAELLSARRVFGTGPSPSGLLGVARRVEELVSLRADAPAELCDAVLRLTALEPADRPATAREAADLLRRAAARVPERNSLSVFLERVFERYLPDPLGATDPEARGRSEPSDPAPGADLGGSELGADPAPLEGDPTLILPADRAEAEAWATQERAREGSAAVYDGGWPREYLDPSPKLELVARSSSVEAMQYFGAQGSSAPAPATAARGGALPGDGEPPKSASGARAPSEPGRAGEGAAGAGGTGHEASAAGQARRLKMPSLKGGLPHAGGAGLAAEAAPDPHAAARVVPKLLQLDGPAPVAAAPTSPVKRAMPFAALGLLIAGVGFGVVALFAPRGGPPPEPKPESGALVVTSTPPGAAVFVDGQRTSAETPAVLSGLPLGRPLRVQVALPGHRSTPAEAEVVIPETSGRTQASFTLRRGRSFRVESAPPNATVSLGGARLSGLTPLELPVIPLGETATLAVTLDGFLPAELRLAARAETATVVEVKLEPSRLVDVLSEPPGATVLVDQRRAGTTPLYDLQVPEQRAVRVRVEKRGYKPWSQQLRARTLASRALTAELEALPLLSVPMSKEERDEARELERSVQRVQSALRQAQQRLGAAERRLAQVEAQPTAMIARLTDAQSAVDDARAELEALEAQRTEHDAHLEAFRVKVLSKLEGTPP